MDKATKTYKERLLDAGIDMMWDRGFNDTGIQELANRAGVPKGSFYNYFSSKEVFAIAVVEEYSEKILMHLRDSLLVGEHTPLSRIFALYKDWAENFDTNGRRGCLIGNLTPEVANQRPLLQEALGRCYERFRNHIVQAVSLAQESGEVNTDISANQLGTEVHNGWNGALIHAKTVAKNEPLLQFTECLLPRILGV